MGRAATPLCHAVRAMASYCRPTCPTNVTRQFVHLHCCLPHFADLTWCTSSQRDAGWRWRRCQCIAVHKRCQVLACAGGPSRITVAPAQLTVSSSPKALCVAVCAGARPDWHAHAQTLAAGVTRSLTTPNRAARSWACHMGRRLRRLPAAVVPKPMSALPISCTHTSVVAGT